MTGERENELMTTQAVTANRLEDGTVVYLTASGTWSESLSDAALAAEDTAAELLARAEREPLVVVGPYLIEVVANGTGRKLANVRERIRAAGPTVRLDHGKQAGN